jgi:hypothetical protein
MVQGETKNSKYLVLYKAVNKAHFRMHLQMFINTFD